MPTPEPTLAPTATPASSGSQNGGIAIGYYRPAFPNNLSAVDEYEARSRHQTSIIHWYAYWGGWKKDFSRSDLDIVSNRGSIPMITWEPWAGNTSDPNWTLRGAILSGKHDAYIDSWARGLAEYGQPVLLRFAHEMHHHSYPWAVGVNGNTADEYVAAWKHVHAIFARYDTRNVQWVWNPNTMGDSTASRYLPIYQSLYPGDEYVDWIGLDIYNTGPNLNWGAPYWRSFTEVMAEPYQAITQVSSKPLILPEIGSTETGGSKAEWVSDALSPAVLAEFPQLRGLVWFDIGKEQAWHLHSSTSARDAWIEAIRASLFAVADRFT